jgi:hypothetical protein
MYLTFRSPANWMEVRATRGKPHCLSTKFRLKTLSSSIAFRIIGFIALLRLTTKEDIPPILTQSTFSCNFQTVINVVRVHYHHTRTIRDSDVLLYALTTILICSASALDSKVVEDHL